MKKIILRTLVFAALVLCGIAALPSCTIFDNDKDITSLADLKGKTVGVETGSIYDEELSGQKNAFSLRRYTDTKAGVTALTEGEIDAWKDDEIVISASEMKRQGIKIGFRDDRSFDIGFAFRKDSQALVNQFNAFLTEARQNGLYNEIYERWFGTDEPEKVMMPDIKLPAAGEVLPVGVNNIIAPMAFQEGTEWRGFEIELITRFAARLNRPLSITLYTIADIPSALESGAIDLWSGEIFITPERQEKYLFSNPYFACHPAWFVRIVR